MKWFLGLLLVLFYSVTILCAEPITARSTKVFSIPGEYQVRIDYLTGTNPVYIGYADKGIATTDSNWFIIKITWSGDNATVVQTANNVIWDNRATSVSYS
jgi:hypothetical protein